MTGTFPRIDPARTALLVMDYQAAVLGALADPQPLLDRAADAIAAVRRGGGHIGYVRVAFSDADLAAIPDSNKMAERVTASGKSLHSDSPATAIHTNLAPEPGDIVVRKTRIGAFSTTDLDRQLRERGITTLILAGVSTSGVVLSTVRDAADRDYRLFVLADAIADGDPDVHDFLITKIFPRQTDVITLAQLKDLMTP
jgi:nicotinamidase-related amidase